MPVEVSSEFQKAVTEPLIPSLYAGITAGGTGAVFGSLYAATKGRHAGLFGVAAGTQWFILGSTFWYSRNLLKTVSKDQLSSSREEILCSTGAGAFAGAAAGALRSRHNVIPGAIIVSLLGASGQLGVNALFSRIESKGETRPMLDRLSDSKWWPLKSVSDDDYEKMLNDKILVLEAEIALIDDKIASLQKQGSNR